MIIARTTNIWVDWLSCSCNDWLNIAFKCREQDVTCLCFWGVRCQRPEGGPQCPTDGASHCFSQLEGSRYKSATRRASCHAVHTSLGLYCSPCGLARLYAGLTSIRIVDEVVCPFQCIAIGFEHIAIYICQDNTFHARQFRTSCSNTARGGSCQLTCRVRTGEINS